MSDPMTDALASLQSPSDDASPDMAARNAAIINQFNAANPHERAARNQKKMNPPNYDELIQKLHGIDAEIMQGKMADPSRFNPQMLKQAQLAQAMGKHDLAYNMLNEENRKLISRDAIGGAPLSTNAWERLRDNAGRQAIQRHHVEESQDSGPVQIPGGIMQQQMLSSAMAAPNAKDDLYKLGVEAFDRQFGKHKRYLVEDHPTAIPAMAPSVNKNLQSAPPTPGGPAVPPGLESIVHNAGVIGQQQASGAPQVPPQQFSQQLGNQNG